MEIKFSHKDGIAILDIYGNLNSPVAEYFRSEFEKYTTQYHNFVFNMKHVDFMDSHGLGKMVSALKTVAKKKGDIKLACLNDSVMMIFEVTRAHKIFDIFDDVDTAVSSF
jgi:anti-sigma B factor antagonist